MDGGIAKTHLWLATGHIILDKIASNAEPKVSQARKVVRY